MSFEVEVLYDSVIHLQGLAIGQLVINTVIAIILGYLIVKVRQ